MLSLLAIPKKNNGQPKALVQIILVLFHLRGNMLSIQDGGTKDVNRSTQSDSHNFDFVDHNEPSVSITARCLVGYFKICIYVAVFDFKITINS